MFVAVFFQALLFNPFGIGTALLFGLVAASGRTVFLAAAAGTAAFRLTEYPLIFLPHVDFFVLTVGLLGCWFWAAFSNRVVRPRLVALLSKGKVS